MTLQQQPLCVETTPPVRWQKLQQLLAVIAVLSSMALVVLDAAMMNTAVPTIADKLGVAPASALNVVTCYQTAILMALFPCSAIGESLGYRRTFLMGVLIFIAAAAVGAWTSSYNLLVAARFIQGVGGAAIMSLGVALLRQSLPARLFGAAIGWNALTIALCSALGPTLAAVVIAFAGWKWLLIVHLPLGLVAVIASHGLTAVEGTRRNLDPVSLGWKDVSNQWGTPRGIDHNVSTGLTTPMGPLFKTCV